MSDHPFQRSSLGVLGALTLLPGLVLAQVSPVEFNTPGIDNFTVPENVSKVSVQIWGGGAGGRTAAQNADAGGGGGGFAALNDFAVVSGQSYRVVVGAGGASGAVGQPSAFGGTAAVAAGCIGTDADACAAGGRVTFPPGSYGGCSTNAPVTLPEAPPDACKGDVVFAGGNGNAPGGSPTGGGGGGSAFTDANGGDGWAGSAGGTGGTGTGNGGNGGVSGASGSPGIFPGGGGGGKGAAGGPSSGAGAGGRVIVSFEIDPPPPPPSATAIPTASTWGLMLLGGLLGGLGMRRLRSKP